MNMDQVLILAFIHNCCWVTELILVQPLNSVGVSAMDEHVAIIYSARSCAIVGRRYIKATAE